MYTLDCLVFFVDLSNQKYDSDEVNIMKAFYCNQRKCLTYVTVGVFYPFFYGILFYYLYTMEVKEEGQMKCTYTLSYSHESCGFVSLLVIPSHRSFHISKRNRGRGKKSDVIVA